jgi:protein O-GlcNAc transferase
VTDHYLDSPGTDNYHSEKSYRLPDLFWCYQPPDASPEVSSLPAIGHGGVTRLPE